jgi:hypothetical protein
MPLLMLPLLMLPLLLLPLLLLFFLSFAYCAVGSFLGRTIC